MQHDKTVSDPTVERICDLKGRLQECLTEAEQVRARFTKAREEATKWPDVEGAFGRVIAREHPSRSDARVTRFPPR
jgi:hypothetical protein